MSIPTFSFVKSLFHFDSRVSQRITPFVFFPSRRHFSSPKNNNNNNINNINKNNNNNNNINFKNINNFHNFHNNIKNQSYHKNNILSCQKQSLIQIRTNTTSASTSSVSIQEFNKVKAEVFKLLKEEIPSSEEYLQQTRENIKELDDWFQKAGFTSSNEDGALVLQRELHGHSFTASFYFEEQEDEDEEGEGENEDEKEDRNEEEEEEKEADEEEGKQRAHLVNVDMKIKTDSDATFLVAEGFIQEGQILVSNLRIEDQTAAGSNDSESSIRLVDLPQELQYKIYDFIDLFGLNNSPLLESATNYLTHAQSQTFFENLKKLTSFFLQ